MNNNTTHVHDDIDMNGTIAATTHEIQKINAVLRTTTPQKMTTTARIMNMGNHSDSKHDSDTVDFRCSHFFSTASVLCHYKLIA